MTTRRKLVIAGAIAGGTGLCLITGGGIGVAMAGGAFGIQLPVIGSFGGTMGAIFGDVFADYVT